MEHLPNEFFGEGTAVAKTEWDEAENVWNSSILFIYPTPPKKTVAEIPQCGKLAKSLGGTSF